MKEKRDRRESNMKYKIYAVHGDTHGMAKTKGGDTGEEISIYEGMISSQLFHDVFCLSNLTQTGRGRITGTEEFFSTANRCRIGREGDIIFDRGKGV